MILASMCISAACALLQPRQPHSVIATLLLIVAVSL